MAEGKRLRRFAGLRPRILAWMTLVALAPLIVMAYQGYHCASEAVVETKRSHLESVLESRKAHFAGRLSEVRADARFLAAAACAQKGCAGPMACGDADAACDFLGDLHRRSGSYEAIISFAADWSVFAQAGAAESASSLPDDFRAKLAASNSLVIGKPFVKEDAGAAVFVGHAIPGEGGQPNGYAVALLNIAGISAPILNAPTGLGSTGRVYLVSRDGRYLSTPALPGAGGQRLPGKAGYPSPAPNAVGHHHYAPAMRLPPAAPGDVAGLPQEVLQSSGKVVEYTRGGVRMLGASALIPEFGAVLVVEMDSGEAFAWLGMLRMRALITGLVTLAMVVLVAVKSADGLSKPLRKLAEAARKVARGRHEERVEPLQGTEADEVGVAFNSMLDELEAGHRRLVHSASLAAVGELSSRIVHEMRNPLSSIKINLQALRVRVADDAAYSELAEIALRQELRLEQMLSGLLGYGKPLELNTACVAFRSVAADAVDDVREQAAGKGVEIEISDRLGGRTLLADTELLRQAMANLLINAVQAVPEGGRVAIDAVTCLPVGMGDAGAPDQARISVSDNGPGIASHAMEKLFRPFFTTRDSGTGLGLANVRKIIDYHGGSISAANRPEGGAVFTIILPHGNDHEQNPDN